MESRVRFTDVLCLIAIFLCSLSKVRGVLITTYSPCDNKVLYFEKVVESSENMWKGIINLGLFPHLTGAEVDIDFTTKNSFTIVGVSVTTEIKYPGEFILKLIPNLLQKPYSFWIKLHSSCAKPRIKSVALNGVVICKENVKQVVPQPLQLVAPMPAFTRHVCGRKPLKHMALVTLGSESRRGDWPWHVAIYLYDPFFARKNYRCGGSVISYSAILTAAHCTLVHGQVIEARRLVVVAGKNNLIACNNANTQEVQAFEVAVHPHYSNESMTADLAVVKVPNLQFTDYVQPVCLWGPTYCHKSQLFGKYGTVAGWGLTENDTMSDVLRHIQIQIVSDTTCITSLPGFYEKFLNDFSFCAGNGPEGGNACNGDSGGGLVFPAPQADNRVSWFLRGITSLSVARPDRTSCDSTHYVLYTDVSAYYTWVAYHANIVINSSP